jgi:hypothetical protein
MEFGLVAQQNDSRCWLHSTTRLHACTLARMTDFIIGEIAAEKFGVVTQFGRRER